MTTALRTRARLLVAVVAGLLIATACTSSSTSPKPSTRHDVLVGEVDGGKALIAIVRSSKGLTIYTCGRGPNLATHTGWFFGVPRVEGSDLGIPELTSAGGLELKGRIGSNAASGTLKLNDGKVVSWNARPARGGAGLYEAEDTLALSGLVVTNDGRMAGNAKLTTAVAGATAPVASVAVTVTGGAPTTSANPVNVTFPVGAVTRTVPLQPVLAPSAKAILKSGPAVVFLVHGMSDSTAGNPPAPKLPECEGIRNTPFYSRCEWGIDFIPGLFGNAPASTNSLFTLAGQDVSGARYLEAARTVPLIDENLGITARDANGCVTNAAQVETFDANAAAHFVTTPRPTPGTPPRLSVFTTWRDSTRGVVESGRRVASQAYAALKWYEQEYRVTPAVYFVAQSFGGLATRFLLSNPPREVYNTPLLNADGIFVCPEDRAKMDYLRDRTVLVHTLATPHEGSYMSEWGEPPKVLLRDALRDLSTGLDRTMLARVLRAVDAGIAGVPGGPPPPNLVGRAQDQIAALLELLDTPALRDMKLDTMVAFNRGPLSPERARRSAGSPIAGAQGTLIPIYATLGRSPGSAVFDSPKLLEGFTEYQTETEKEKGWIIGTMFFSDVLVRQFIPNGYGRVDVPPYLGFANLLDRRARLFDLSTETTAAEQFTAAAAEAMLDGLDAYFAGRYGPAVGGVLEYLASLRFQTFLPNAMVPIHVDRVWKLGLSGSVEVPMIALACGGQRVVIDYGPLVQALLAGGRRTEAALTAVGNQDVRQLMATAFGAGADAGALVLGATRWFQDKLRAINDMPESCRLPLAPESLGDLLDVANIVNWRVARATGTVPAPAWERTATPARDGEMDADGPVHSASALGFTLGRRPFFFEHDREDGPVIGGRPTLGSWYRMPDNPVTEQYNHGLQYQNDVARGVARRLLNPAVGPVPQRTGDSSWP